MDNNNLSGNKAWIDFAKILTLFSLLLIVFFGVKTLVAIKNFGYSDYDKIPHNAITVSGKGEVFVKPDIATLSFSAVENAPSVADAQKKATDKISAVLDFLKKQSIAEKDIKTTGYNIYPKYDYQSSVCKQGYCPPSRQILSGYEVSQSVEVKIREISKSGAILSGIGEFGVTNVSGITFSVDKEDDFKAEARKAAIDDAKAKADVLAKDLGVKLGKIISFSDESAGVIYPMYDKVMSAPMGMGGGVSAPVPVPTGENKISSNVSISYEIR